MRRIFCLLIAILFLFPLVAEARRRPDSLNTIVAGSSSTNIVRGDARIWGVTLRATTGVGTLTIYDEYSSTSLDESEIVCEISEATTGNSQTLHFDPPLDCSSGLYVEMTNGEYVIVYE